MLHTDTINRMKPGQLVQHYLLASFGYYQLNRSPMTDHAFDRLCVRLLEIFDTVEHAHKHLIDKESLGAGTCLLSVEDYPLIIQCSADKYCGECETGRMATQIEPFLLPATTRAAPRRIVRTVAPVPQAVPARRIVRSATKK